MPLTETQNTNLANMDKLDLLDIMHECAELLGVVSVAEYEEATGMKKRTIYEHVKNGKIKSFNNSGKINPCLNIY